MAKDLEKQIQSLGKQLLELARKKEATLIKKHRWENALLDWCMKNPELKTRTFRFIDVFPQLASAASVLRHIREYFPSTEDRIPRTIRAGLLLARPSVITQGVVHHLTRSMFLKISKLFVAASDEAEALKVLGALDHHGIRCSMDLLGEKTMSEAEAETYLKRYLLLIREMGKTQLGIENKNISVKLSALDPEFDTQDPVSTSERVRKRLREILRVAQQNGVFVHIDMEEYEIRDLTLNIIEDMLAETKFQDITSIGIVLQAYLKDADPFLDKILSWSSSLRHPLTIRLVRGAYWDQEIMNAREQGWEVPVFTTKNDTDFMFEHLTEKILNEVPKVRLAVATHNIRSIAHAMVLQEIRGIDKQFLEFQLLYGMGDPLMHALREMHFNPRIYMPIGDPVWGMSYLVRRLLENVSSQSFVRRGIHESTDAKKLLDPPIKRSRKMLSELKSENSEEHSKVYEPCPSLEFFKEDIQRLFKSGLDQAKASLGEQLPLVIDGKERQKKERIKTVSPIDGSLEIVSASKATVKDAEDAILAAEKNFPKWAAIPAEERVELLRKAASWMTEHRIELAATEVYEVGKPQTEADLDVKEAIDFLNFYAASAECLLKDRPTENLSDEINVLRPKPRGVCAVISPWNFPIAILTGMSAAALVSGNTVILKPAEQSNLCGWKVFRAYQEAGFPKGVVNFLSGYGEDVGPTLVNDARVATIAFTGSKDVGLSIAGNANARKNYQKYIKKLIIEMGGKNAAIVDETADLDQTIPAVLASAFGFAGQKCSALSRLIVVDSIYKTFIARLLQAAASFPVGNPENPHIKCGPVITLSDKQRIREAIEEGQRSGKVLFQADLSHLHHGYYVPPTILSDLPSNSYLLKEEIFGPVLVIVRAKTFQDALSEANHTDFALTGGIFSRTPSHIEKAKQDFEVGNLYINRAITGAIVGRHPFGGYQLSGTGTKAGGRDYLREFFVERSISENVSRHGFAPLETP